MKITAARVIVCCPGRNFVTLKIETDQGLCGIGDATLNGRELAVASYLDEHVIPCLIGRDARQIEDLWQYLYRGAYWRRGPVTMTRHRRGGHRALGPQGPGRRHAAVPVAGRPQPQRRDGVRPCQRRRHRRSRGRSAALCKEMGYRAIRVQSGVPGLPQNYGVGRGRLFYEPADAALPSAHEWSTEKYLDHTPRLFDAVRSRLGWDHHLLHDVHHRLTPIEAARLGRALEPYRLFWMEDATPAENQEGFRLIRQHTTTPLAVGEVFNTVWDCKDLIQNQWIDYIRATVVHAGGITHLRRIADFAAMYQVRTGCHGATDLSPVCMGAALHFDLWVPNFGIQEYMRHSEATDAVFPHAYTFADGMLHPGEVPGHGVRVDEALAAKYPYQRAYLPVNRLQHDGTLWHW